MSLKKFQKKTLIDFWNAAAIAVVKVLIKMLLVMVISWAFDQINYTT